jgi:hypothetical protein
MPGPACLPGRGEPYARLGLRRPRLRENAPVLDSSLVRCRIAEDSDKNLVCERFTGSVRRECLDLFRLGVSSTPGSFKISDSTSLYLLRRSARSHPVLLSFRRRLGAAVTAAVERVKSAFREATRPLPRVARFAMDPTRSRRELHAENALLRQPLIVGSRSVKRPAFRPHERGLVVLLARLVPRWRDAVLLVKPDTVFR